METITLTLGDVAENHVGMEKIGDISSNGFSNEQIMLLDLHFRQNKITTELINLGNTEFHPEPVYVLVVRNLVKYILKKIPIQELFEEQKKLNWDKKALIYGRVLNKKIRYNLCYNNTASEPDYENGKGRVIAYDTVPLLNLVRQNIIEILVTLGILNFDETLVTEGNYYYSPKCGIKFHGDSERRKVIGIRLGDSMPLWYRWYHKSNPISELIEIKLNGGDVYFMSDKAVGYDWLKSSIPTLRHAAGTKKFIV